jgi:PKD repeat protein
MKYIYSLLLVLLTAFSSPAQNCNWTATNPTGNVAVLIPSPGFPAGQFYGIWTFGNGTSSGPVVVGPFTQVYSSPGVYSVCLNVYDSLNGGIICTYCDSILVGTNSCSFSFTQDSTNANQYYFNANLQGTNTTANWSFGDGSNGTGNNVTHTYAATGTYTVTMTEVDFFNNVICSYTYTIVINSSISCAFGYTFPNPAQNPALLQFNAAFNAPGAQYIWDFGDNSLPVTGNNPQHAFAQPGAYNVCLTIISGVDTCFNCMMIPVGGGGGSNCSFIATPDSSNPSSFTFLATGTNPNNAIVWNFGDGSTGFGMIASHTYSSTGTFTVCMDEIDSSGAIICSFCFPVQTNGGGGGINCNFTVSTWPGNPTIFTFAIPQAINTAYFWDLGNGVTATGNNVAHNYAAPGTYNVCLTASNGITSCTSCQTVIVPPNPNPCSFIATPDSGLANSFYFVGIPSQLITGLTWDFGDNTTGVGNNLSHTYPGPGTYQVCMNEIELATGNIVCTSCMAVTVGNSNCTFTATAAPGNPGTFSFNTQGIPNNTYYWDFGNGATATGNNIAYTYPSPGVYNVCLNVGNGGAIICTSCQTITVPPNNPSCVANFTSVSIGLIAYFIDQSTVNPPNVPPLPVPVNYSWNFGDGNSSTLQFPQHQYSAPGTYLVCLTVSTVGCTTTYCDSIVIDTTINNPIGCNAYFIFTQTTPYQLIGVNLSNGVNLNFSWNFGDGSPLGSGAYPTHQYANTGTYVVCLTVSDFLGCNDTYCDTITVDSLGNIIYRGFSANAGFTLNIISPSQLTSGLDDQTNTISRIYPVPATDRLFVEWAANTADALNYQVISVDGREVMKGLVTRTANQLNTESLSPGIYLFRVINADGSADSKTFVKQ